MELKDPNGEDLSARVADLEKCIGDFAEVFAALKDAVNKIEPPDCPPYCMHNMDAANEAEYANYTDPAKLEDRVADIRRFIGDHGAVFTVLRDSLNARPGPDCPPYCAHEITKGL